MTSTTQDTDALPNGWQMNANGGGGATRLLPDGHVTVWPCPGQSVAVSAATADAVDDEAARRRLNGPTNTDICEALHAQHVAALRAGGAA
jgi:hypothetical protein